MSPRISLVQEGLPSEIEKGALAASEKHSGQSIIRGTVVIVPTPIGNWDDITLRALQSLRNADIIAAEHPHVTRRLLHHFQISKEIRRYSGCPEHLPPLIACLDAGQTVALVCDAGTPAIADPGSGFIRAALKDKHRVVALPGAVAGIVGLTASGMAVQRFTFDGCPPRNPADRGIFFARLAAETRTMILYESGAFLFATITALIDHLGFQRQIAVARNLTTRRETWWRGTLQEVQTAINPRMRGQYVLIIAGISKDF